MTLLFVALIAALVTPPATAPKLALRPHLAALRRTPGTPLLRASQPDAELRHLNLALPNAHLYAARGAKTSVALDADTKLITIGSAKIVLDKSIIRPLLFIAVILGLKVLQVVRTWGTRSALDEPVGKFTSATLAEQSELKEFQCSSCGFTIFPARGREGKFFPDSFRCPNCGARKEAFFDMNDLSDPRTVAAQASDKDFQYSVQDVEVTVDADDEGGADDGPAPPGPSPPPAPGPGPSPPPSDFDPLRNSLL